MCVCVCVFLQATCLTDSVMFIANWWPAVVKGSMKNLRAILLLCSFQTGESKSGTDVVFSVEHIERLCERLLLTFAQS